MVSTVASADALHVQLCAGLGAEDSARVRRALDFVQPLYAGKTALTGQDALQFAQTAASVLATRRALTSSLALAASRSSTGRPPSARAWRITCGSSIFRPRSHMSAKTCAT